MSYQDEQAILKLKEKENYSRTGKKDKDTESLKRSIPRWTGFTNESSVKAKNLRGNLQHVKITSVSIPFHQMVWLLVQLALAAIPAAIIVAVIWMLIADVLFNAF